MRRLLLLSLLLAACGSEDTIPLDDTDAGTARDAGRRDAGPARDAGVDRDAGMDRDAGTADAGIRIPIRHRETATACEATRASPAVTDDGNPNNECGAHSDCDQGIEGRCSATRFGYVCTYHECLDDGDCSTVCQCDGGFASDHNVCLRQGNCSVDADCGAGGFCSPTQGECGDYSGTVAYFCHTAQDECIDDADCGAYPWYCSYDQGIGRWTCSDSHCAG